MKKAKILVVAANPKDTSRLRLDEEVREIEEALRRSTGRAEFTVRAIWAPRPRDLRRALLDEQPRIVHFSGHSDIDGLALENAEGDAVGVPPEALKDLFNLFSNCLECILLNACYSEGQAIALASRIPYVIGMREEIADEAALEFAIGFYDALGARRPVDEAFQFGCNAIDLLGKGEKPFPILLLMSDVQAGNRELALANCIYRFRAECQADVDELRRLLGARFDKITMVNLGLFPDVEVELETILSLEELRCIMRRVVDGHVMVQTVARRDDYTGERNYDLR